MSPLRLDKKVIGALGVLVMLAAPACSDDNTSGPFTINEEGEIQVKADGEPKFNGDAIGINPSAYDVGSTAVVSLLEITNLGNGPLDVSEISITSDPPDLFALESVDASALPTSGSPWRVFDIFSSESPRNKSVRVKFTRPAGDATITGSITVRSNTVDPDRRVLTFPIEVQDLAPNITVNPGTVDFGNVGQGETKTIDVSILNTGTDILEVSGFKLSGDPAFKLIDGQGQWSADGETATGVDFAEAIEIDPGSKHTVKMQFAPEGPEGASGELVLISNDLDTPETTVLLKGNQGGPCLALNPKRVDFGGKLIGKTATIEVEVISCGDAPVEIQQMALLDNTDKPDIDLSGDFNLDLGGLPGMDPGTTGLTTDDAPVTLAINESATFTVQFTPDEINPLDGNGKPIPDLQFIHIVSNTFVKDLEVEVRGFGVEVECPTSVIKVQEGEEVIPQTKLHLIGSQSFAATGNIAKYEWTVQQPPGSQSVFLPSAAAPDPTFEVNVAGTYIFKLEVWDANNTKSCEPAEFQVFVNPDEAIHVELLWDTPNDPDQTDEGPEAGADVDLHFTHQFATGSTDGDGDGVNDGWFDAPFDCFWFNPNPNWGSFDPMVDDDPGLDRDDTDGAGPENMNLNIPEDGLTYKVGVHYWADHGFGPSLATVRVYIMSVLVFQVEEVELVNHDFWEVATVSWPSGEVKPITGSAGGYKIMPNYEDPLFFGE